MSDGFYKLESGTIHHAPNSVRCNEYQLFRDQKDTYTYPVDGWRWFDSAADAEAFFLPAISQSLQLQIDALKQLNEPSPDRITKYQATKWLRDSGLYGTVMQMLESNQDAKDRWTLSPVLLRDDPIVIAMGQLLGLTTQQLSDAFTAASQIQ